MSRTYTIRVGWLDILRGKRFGASGLGGKSCPVRLAVVRATGGDYGIGYDGIRFFGVRSVSHIPLTDETRSFMYAFDDCVHWVSRLALRPFTFELTIP